MQDTVFVLADEARFEGIYLDRDVAERDRVSAGLAPCALREVALVCPPESVFILDDWTEDGMASTEEACYVAYRMGGEPRELVSCGGSLDARVATILHESLAAPEFERFVACARDCFEDREGRFVPDDELEPPHEPTRLALDLYGRITYDNCTFVSEVASAIVWGGIERDNLEDGEAADGQTMEFLRRACMMSIETYWDQFTRSWLLGVFNDAYDRATDVRGRKAVLNLWSASLRWGIPYLATAVEMIEDDDFPEWWRGFAQIWES